MDYEIMLTTLGNKKEELDDQKSKVESAIEDSASTLSSMGETPIASLYDKIQNSTDNVKKAYEKTSEWFDKYTKELNELENSLATFSCNGVEAPIEFKDNFVDIFGKKLIPTLRAGGDSNANTDLNKVNSSSQYAIPPHSLVDRDGTRQERLAIVGGECGTEAEQDAKMETIQVPYWDGNKVSTMSLTVNRALVTNYTNVFQKLADMKYTILPETTGAYNYNHARRPSGAPSDHTLGSAIDLNWDNNWNTGDGSQHSVRGKEDVISAFASEGFYWGGDWTNPDDMHFSFTGY